MSKKDRILLVVLAAALALSVAVTFYQTIVKKDFEVVNVDDGSDASDALGTQAE